MIEKLIMTGYDAMKQEAAIAYMSKVGKVTDLRIHQSTFKTLMEDKWDIDTYGEPSSILVDLKEAVKRELKKKPAMEWFMESANEIMKSEANNAKVSKVS